MTSTARRRWSRELQSEIDGIALSPDGPILVHGYDAPAGGMWIDEVIPGKLGAIDRNSGETLWSSPCEVGYGRGFAAGFGEGDDVIVLGPSAQGHRIIRMETATGRLLGAESIEAFDEAMVYGDLCICANAGRVFGLSTAMMAEAWEYHAEGERYHLLGRSGDEVLVVYSDRQTDLRGVLVLDAVSGEVVRTLLSPCLGVIHGLAVDGDRAVLLTADIQGALPDELATQLLVDLSQNEDDDVAMDTLSLLGLSLAGEAAAEPRWYEILSTRPSPDLPEASINADSGKLYVVSGALLEVRDIVSGRVLGDWTIPGLDEQVGWQVRHGAGLLAEEHRLSVFELPA